MHICTVLIIRSSGPGSQFAASPTLVVLCYISFWHRQDPRVSGELPSTPPITHHLGIRAGAARRLTLAIFVDGCSDEKGGGTNQGAEPTRSEPEREAGEMRGEQVSRPCLGNSTTALGKESP